MIALVLVVLALLLLPGTAAAAEPSKSPAAVPIVMLVLDEFTGTSLLDAKNQVDPVLYPNFAKLVGDGTYYRNFTAAADETTRVLSALLTGDAWKEGVAPSASNYPRNLFTLLGHAGYHMRVRQAATNLCPYRLCRDRWHATRGILHELGGGVRPARFAQWLSMVDGRVDRTLYFKHVLLPHVPWQYLPDGRMYRRHPVEYIEGLNGAPSFGDDWLLQQGLQRHLMQAGLVDRMLGRLVDRLKQRGIYDKALIVVTADNGESFLHRNHDRHIADAVTFTDIASTPLVIKRPGEHSGRYDDRHVRTFDVVPTIADAAGIKLPWKVVGRSIYRGGIPSVVEVHREQHGKGNVFRISLSGYERERGRALARKIALFGSDGNGPGLFGLGPNSGLIGQAVADLKPASSGTVHGAVTPEVRRLLARVRLSSSFLPANVTGSVTGVGRGAALALALNGRIAAVGRTAQLYGDQHVYFSFFAPPEAFVSGPNRAEVFLVTGPGRLQRIASS